MKYGVTDKNKHYTENYIRATNPSSRYYIVSEKYSEVQQREATRDHIKVLERDETYYQ